MRRPALALTVRGLSKRFGEVRVLEGVGFEVHPRETLILWGGNGAGKTTVLRCLLGVIPFQGTLSVCGRDVRTDGKAARACIGYVPQEVRLHADLTVRETILFHAALRRANPRQTLEDLDGWGLGGSVLHRPVEALSGGMKQKLALAVALISDPPVLLLDEPTSHLDLRSRREFTALLMELKHRGKTMVLCSHRSDEFWKLADRVAVLESGRVVCAGSPPQVAAHLGEQVTVSLTVHPARIDEAARIVRAGGFEAQRNGAQLWVRVPIHEKIRPVRGLLRAGIPVLDLDMEREET